MGLIHVLLRVAVAAAPASALTIQSSEHGLKERDAVDDALLALGPSSLCSSIVPITDVTSTVTATLDASTLEVTVTAPDCTVTGSPTNTITEVSTETDTETDTATVTTTVTVTSGAAQKRHETQPTSTRARCGRNIGILNRLNVIFYGIHNILHRINILYRVNDIFFDPHRDFV
ncbi:hypothetical protein LQW54_000844 [Pestalotiopsis sp. IQ-011]